MKANTNYPIKEEIYAGTAPSVINLGVDKLSKETTLDKILDYSIDIQNRCSDVTMNLSQATFEAAPIMLRDVGAGNLFDVKQDTPLTSFSFKQLCNRYGLPVNYAKKCLEEKHPELLQTNLSTWMQEDTDEVVLRLFDIGGDTNVVRGIVSKEYSMFDAPNIVTGLMNNRQLSCEYSIRNWLLTPERMQIRLVSNKQLEIAGEDLYMGVIVDSSDVGGMAVSIRVFVYKQICSNGLVLPMTHGLTYRQIHRGKSHEGFDDDIAAILSGIPVVAKTTKDVIEASKGDTKLWFDLENEIAAMAFAKKYGFHYSTVKKAVNIMKANSLHYYDGVPTRWAFINALTEAAQDLSLDGRMIAEGIAGKLIVENRNKIA